MKQLLYPIRNVPSGDGRCVGWEELCVCVCGGWVGVSGFGGGGAWEVARGRFVHAY